MHGIVIALQAGIRPTVIESDCLSFVQMLKGSLVIDSEIGLVLDDIRSFVPNIDRRISHTCRGGDKVAHVLAKWTTANFF